MRLLELTGDRIRIQTFQTSIPSYAALSHTWGEDVSEIKFEDVKDGYVPDETDLNRSGHRKLMFCAKQAQRDGLRYFWVDSCCIDQQNQRELEESIARMFEWYRFAAKCYVYLSDVSFDEQGTDDNLWDWQDSFCQSRWFTRGWTLQELLAPRSVEFFSRQGNLLGTRQSLENHIHTITNIPVDALRGRALELFSVEERMKWAENRKTKKIEDRAYCLQGIFNVFLPTLYGEGNHAFIRLQQAIDAYLTYRIPEYSRKRKRDAQDISIGGERRAYTEPMPPYTINDLPAEVLAPYVSDQLSVSSLDDLIEALSFEQIDDRYENIKANLARTCKWLLTTAEFQNWLRHDKMADHHGFFWIRGKPGCGKSTLTKFCYHHLRKTTEDNLMLSFFFNARGAELERSTIGLYRSLLVQILKHRTQRINSQSLILPDVALSDRIINQLESLKEILRQTLKRVKDRSVLLVIDALDEGNEDDVRDMIRFFSNIGTEAADEGRTFRVFFSSRHYPYITIQPSTGIIVENQSGHSQDIELYIQTQLGIKGESAEKLRGEIKTRASGIFMWVVLVVKILNKMHDRGQREQTLLKELRKIPSDLYELLRNIISRDDEDLDTMKLCMQWILYAKQPLLPDEFHHAILIGIGVKEGSLTLRDLPHPDGSTEGTTERFIIHHSKGLAEVTRTKRPKVQFIHESVRDFLQKEHGLGRIWGDLANDPGPSSHQTLARCCLALLASETINMLKIPRPLPRVRSEDAQKLISKARSRLPLLTYATEHVFVHIEAAQGGRNKHTLLLQDLVLRLSAWITLANMFESREIRRYSPDIDIHYLLAERDCATLLKFALGSKGPYICQHGRHQYYVFAALANDCLGTFNMLVEHEHSNAYSLLPNPAEGIFTFLIDYASTGAASRFFECFPEHVFNDTRKAQHLLCRAVRHKRRTVIDKLLLLGVQMDWKDASMVIKKATNSGDEDICLILLNRGLISAPLAWEAMVDAMNTGHEDILRLFLEKCSTSTYAGGRHRTHDPVVETQRDYFDGRNLTPCACSGLTQEELPMAALEHAVTRGQSSMVVTILNTGIDVNVETQDDFGNPLIRAAYYGHVDVMRVLLDRDASIVPHRQGKYGNALIASVLGEEPERGLKFLISRRANVNAVTKCKYGSVLVAACTLRDASALRLAKLLLGEKADVNAIVGGRWGSALVAACSRSWCSGDGKDLIRLLLDAGAEVNAKTDGTRYTSALQAARSFIHSGHLELLLTYGSEVGEQFDDK